MSKNSSKKWYDKYPVYLNNINGNLGTHLSPLTNFILNIASRLIGDRHLIIATPSAILQPLSILCYLSGKITDRTVLAFTKHLASTDDDPFTFHHHSYYSLQGLGQDFCFYSVPIAYIKNNELVVDFYLPDATRREKRLFKKKQKLFVQNIYSDKKRAKILLQPDGRNSRIIETFEKLTIEGESLESISQSEIKVVIFENLDRIIYTTYKLETFLEWIRIFDKKNIRMILHFSNPNSRFIIPLKKKMNALLLHLGLALLKNNLWLKKESEIYYSKDPVCTSLNIDNKFLYEGEQRFLIPEPLPNGNIDKHFQTALDYLAKINIRKLPEYLRASIYRFRGLIFGIYNLFINPSRYLLSYYNQTDYTTREIEFFLKHLNRIKFDIDDREEMDALYHALIEFNSMFNELRECKCCRRIKNYCRKSKNYALFEFLENAESGTYVISADKMEKRVLNENLQLLQHRSMETEIKTLDQIQNTIQNTSEKFLILPGPIFPKYMSILFMEWKKIIVFAYQGIDYNRIKKQIALVNKLRIQEESYSIECIKEIGQYIGADGNNPLLVDFNRRKRELEKNFPKNEKHPLSKTNEVENVSIAEIVENVIKKNPEFKTLKDHQDSYEIDSEENKNLQEKIYSSRVDDQEFYIVELYDEIRDVRLTKNLQIDNTYVYLRDRSSNNVKTTFPKYLKKDDYIVFVDQDERKSIVDLISSQLDSDTFIDFNAIERWQRKIGRYYEKNYQNINDFYRDYRNIVKKYKKKPRHRTTLANWVRGETTYTQDPKDLYYIGVIMKDPFFLEEYDHIHEQGKKIQIFHRKLSIKLKKIIVQVLEKNIDLSSLSLDEYEIYRRIEKSIFCIESIFKNKKQEV